MKKVVLFLITLFAFSLQSANAQDSQLTISCDNPDFDVKVKRCLAAGNALFIDVMFTNNGSKDLVGHIAWDSEAYDDEGNSWSAEWGKGLLTKLPDSQAYKGGSEVYVYGGIGFPQNVPRKVGFKMDNLSSESMTIMKFHIVLGIDGVGLTNIDIKNIPILRR